MTTAPVRPMRWLLAAAAVLVFLAGVVLFVQPLRTETRFAWTIASPMTAVFLGAAYWSAVGLEVAGALAPRWAGARVAVPAVLVFTTLTLVVTLVHLDLFHLGTEHASVTRAVTWAWIAVYAAVPVLLGAAWLIQARAHAEVPPARGLPAPLAALLVLIAAVLGVLGVALLLAPGRADAAWPWTLTPLTGRATGAWLVGLALAAGHARLVDDAPSLLPVGVTGVLFGVLQTTALLRYGDELAWPSVPAVGFVVALAAITLAGGWLLAAGVRARPEWHRLPGPGGGRG